MDMNWSEQEVELSGIFFTGVKDRRDAIKKYCKRKDDANDQSKLTLLGHHFANHLNNVVDDCDFLIR